MMRINQKLSRAMIIAITLTLLPCASDTTQAQSAPPMTQADVERLVKELSNWGRWGKDDQLGALNLITPEKRLEAAKLVQKGISVSLAHQMIKQVAPDNQSPFEHTMISDGVTSSGQWATDTYKISYHGLAHTHLDSLCHLFHEGRMYNGFSRAEVGPEGAKKLSIKNARHAVSYTHLTLPTSDLV